MFRVSFFLLFPWLACQESRTSHKLLWVGVVQTDNHIIFVRQNGRNNKHFAISLLFTALRIQHPQ